MFKQFRTEITLIVVTSLTIGFMIFFNDTIKLVRVNELKLFLQKINRDDNNLDHIGLVMKYRQRREQYNNNNIQDNDDLVEMRVQSILSTSDRGEKINFEKNNILIAPALYSINIFRLIMGKPPIKNMAENKSGVYLDIAYYYERNNFYKKALEIYQKALSEEKMDKSQKAGIILHEGFCYSIIGDYKEAKSKYETVIKDYGNESVAVTAALLLRYLEGFMQEIDKVLASEDSVEKGVKLYNLIAYDESLKVFDKVEKNMNVQDKAKIKYFKGRCYEELAMKDKVINTYQELIEEDPTSQYAKLANRRIYIAGSTARNGDKIKELSLKNNQLLKDETLNQMQTEEVKIKKAAEPQEQKKDDLLEKELAKVENEAPIFNKEEIKSYDRIMEKVDTEIKKQEDAAVPKKVVKRDVKVKVNTNDGNTFIGTITEETPEYINLSTIIGTIKIEKKQIDNREILRQ
ncbi:MAG TPA: tetratricopeptide repeat protein [Spirochaetota bacterium]